MRLTEEQRATVERYAVWARQLAFSGQIMLPHHAREDLQQDLCLHAIRIVQTYRGDCLHAACIHGLQLKRRQWLIDRARRRSTSEVHTSWQSGDALPAAEPRARDDRRGVDDRDELAWLTQGMRGFRARAMALRYAEGRTVPETAAAIGLRTSWVQEETLAGLAEARARAAQARGVMPPRPEPPKGPGAAPSERAAHR